MLDASNWKRLAGFARIIPDGDVLPLRAKYRGNSWQIGVNYVHASSDDPKDGLWYAWPDLVASVLLTGKVPRIVEAFRIAPIGKAKGLKQLAVSRASADRSALARLLPGRDRGTRTARSAHRSQRHRARSAAALAQDPRLRDELRNFRPDGSSRERQGSRAHVLRHRSGTVSVQGQTSRSTGRILLPAAGLTHYQRWPSVARAPGETGRRSRWDVRDGGHRLHGDCSLRSAAVSSPVPVAHIQ